MISVPNRAEVMKKVLVRVNKPNLHNNNLLGFGNNLRVSFSRGGVYQRVSNFLRFPGVKII